MIASKPWLINAVHVLAVAPLLFWIGYTHGVGVPSWVFDALAAVAVLIAVFHAYLGYSKMKPLTIVDGFYENYY